MSASDLLSILLGILGLVVSVFAIIDNRRQRTKREQAVMAARATIERIYGLLIGIKPAITSTVPGIESAVNDGLSAINQERDKLDAL